MAMAITSVVNVGEQVDYATLWITVGKELEIDFIEQESFDALWLAVGRLTMQGRLKSTGTRVKK
jgi:hypothetical protein